MYGYVITACATHALDPRQNVKLQIKPATILIGGHKKSNKSTRIYFNRMQYANSANAKSRGPSHKIDNRREEYDELEQMVIFVIIYFFSDFASEPMTRNKVMAKINYRYMARTIM